MSNSPGGVLSSTGAQIFAVVATVFALALGGALGALAHQPESVKVVLEPIDMVPRDAWVSGGADAAPGSEDEIGVSFSGYRPGSEVPDGRRQTVSASLAGNTVRGDSDGVYGGTRDTQVCDKTVLIEFFGDPANAETARLWADLLGLDQAQINNYLQGLTGVRLRWDSRVTDHGIRGTQTTSWQALLQAGTAVLVDNTGVPRVKCNSGSPLLEPLVLKEHDDDDLALDRVAQNPADAWGALDTANTVVIQPVDEPIRTITLVDVEGEEMLERDVGSDGASSRDVGSGDVQFNLKWTSRADLDIHVVDPDGNTYGYDNDYYSGAGDESGEVETSDNGGAHDVDSNIGCEDERDDSGFAKENVFWLPGQAPSGEYTVYVTGYTVEECDPAQSGYFTLTATVGGEVTTYSGVVGEDEDSEQWTFQKPE